MQSNDSWPHVLGRRTGLAYLIGLVIAVGFIVALVKGAVGTAGEHRPAPIKPRAAVAVPEPDAASDCHPATRACHR